MADGLPRPPGRARNDRERVRDPLLLLTWVRSGKDTIETAGVIHFTEGNEDTSVSNNSPLFVPFVAFCSKSERQMDCHARLAGLAMTESGSETRFYC